MKNSGIGLELDIEDIAGYIETTLLNILLYADDIMMFAENEEDLQSSIYIVQVWCEKWRLEVYLSNTNILHIRSKRKSQSMFLPSSASTQLNFNSI